MSCQLAGPDLRPAVRGRSVFAMLPALVMIAIHIHLRIVMLSGHAALHHRRLLNRTGVDGFRLSALHLLPLLAGVDQLCGTG